jgi:hypothetical protein
MSKLRFQLIAFLERIGVPFDDSELQKECDDLRRIIKGLIPEAMKGIDVRLQLLEVNQRITELEAKYGIQKPLPGVA